MRVSRPVVAEDSDQIVVSAGVEISTPCSCDFAPELWFRFPECYREIVSDRADAFAASLVPLAMALGEPIEIEGELSPRLLRGLERWCRIQSVWQPKRFEQVEIVAAELSEPSAEANLGGVGCGFSGGVDSFHTLRGHLEESEPYAEWRISHCLMIAGFGADMDRDGGAAFPRIAAAYEPLMERLGVELVVSRTNIMELFDHSILKASFGAVIAASALALGQQFSRFYIASSYRLDDMLPEGSHLMFDHFFGTETLDVVHDAPDWTRLQKVTALSEWEESYSTLRVCWKGTRLAKEDHSIVNCCRCEKCVRTMVTLKMAGALERFPVFPKPLRHRDIWKQQHRKRGSRIFVRDIMREALRSRHVSVLFDYSVCLILSLVVTVLYEPFRALHLQIEKHSEAYAQRVERRHPRYRRGRRWIRKLGPPKGQATRR